MRACYVEWMLSRSLTTLALLTVLPFASALVVPLQGWMPISGDASQWQDSAGSCLIREDKYGQAFPLLADQKAALAVSNKLRASLTKQGFTEVATQPVQRQGGWGVLASYGYQEGGVNYRVAQLFVSQSGILRTVSGSSAVNNTGACAAMMREFIRYQVN